jgi:endonuclease-3
MVHQHCTTSWPLTTTALRDLPCYNLVVNIRAIEVRQRLLAAYGRPVWRVKLPPLDELVSTILSQNTNDTNRDRAYENLRQVLPTWEAVRDGEPQVVINAIRSAGLANQKGPRIQAILKAITDQVGALDLGFLAGLATTEAREWLLHFKGVGPKTAAIVLLFSLDKHAFPVDTHIYRITGRLGLRPEKMSTDAAHDHLEKQFPPESYYDVHLNIIRLGREICHARKPACPACLLNDICPYFESQKV